MPLLNQDEMSPRQNVSRQNPFSKNVSSQNTLRQNNSNIEYMKLPP